MFCSSKWKIFLVFVHFLVFLTFIIRTTLILQSAARGITCNKCMNNYYMTEQLEAAAGSFSFSFSAEGLFAGKIASVAGKTRKKKKMYKYVNT